MAHTRQQMALTSLIVPARMGQVPIQKQFPKTLLAKFAWAMAVEPTFKF